MNLQKYKFIKSEYGYIWERELQRILYRDIHQDDLGCCVNDTHMKIGDIHLGTFFEAQFLFGNAYWISIFSNALKNEIVKKQNLKENDNRKFLLIGYETYIEPVLIHIVDLLKKDGYSVDYCIYEEPKYIHYDMKSNVRLRCNSDNAIQDYDSYIVLCGISSTLNTSYQMISKVKEEINNIKKIENLKNTEYDKIIKKAFFYSIIQVLPSSLNKDNNSNEFELSENDCLINDSNNRILSRNKYSIEAKYLTSVFCEWQNAKACKWCFDKEEERPLVATNETSIIPIQMIGSPNKPLDNKENNNQIAKLDFFKKDDEKDFFYLDYLYYDHIERSGHHYQYYIRTNALFKEILNKESNKFDDFCNDVKKELFKESKKRIDVVVVPAHYSNELFFNAICKNVFGSNCEIISVLPKKEFRSNFETKYSNYAFIFDALSDDETIVCFHYVDDQLITGDSFYRAKSFINSLMKKSNISFDNVQSKTRLFESVIVLVNRNSKSTKHNYIENDNKFFSLIDIEVPFLRNYGDSCYLCSKTQTAKKIKQNSATISMSEFWAEKEDYHSVKTIEKAKSLQKERDVELKKRKFRRFYCENLLWKTLRDNWDDECSIYNKIVEIISSDIKNYDVSKKYEYLISFIKILSRPFLFYRENIKKAVLSLLIYVINILNMDSDIAPQSILALLKKLGNKDKSEALEFIKIYDYSKVRHCRTLKKEKYYLYVILLANLCSINSSYLLNVENIILAMNFYENLSLGKDDKITSMSKQIKRCIKNATNGISGYYKALYLDNNIKSWLLNNNQYNKLLENIYLENLEAENKKDSNNEKYFDENDSLKEKYTNILNNILPKDSKAFIIINFSSEDSYVLAKKNSEQSEKIILDRSVSRFDQDIIIEDDYFAIRCYYKENEKTSSVYLLAEYDKPNSNRIDKLSFIRSVLIHRYQLTHIINEDVKSGSIVELINDEILVDTLSQPKTVSHGKSEDIDKHLIVLEKIYSHYKKSQASLETEGIFNVNDQITLFSNLLISHYHLNRISNERGKTYKFRDELILVRNNSIKNINELNYDINELIETDAMFDEKPNRIIQNLLKKNMNISTVFFNRFDYYISCLKSEGYSNIECTYNDAKNQSYQYSIIYPNNTKISSVWVSIALIHMLVRNAIQHGMKDEKIEIIFEKNAESYDLIVQNKTSQSNDAKESGITQKALEKIFNCSNCNSEIKFEIDNDIYISKITNFLQEKNE